MEYTAKTVAVSKCFQICTLHVYKPVCKLDKLLVCKVADCLFVTTTVSICANYLHTHL